jgi:hypothetical protein
MELEGEQIRFVILGHLVACASSWDSSRLELDLRADQISLLSRLPSADLALLARLRDPRIRLDLDIEELRRSIEALTANPQSEAS